MGNPTVKIYLTNWQMRMVQDFLHTPCEALEISVDSSANHKYGVKSNITDREVEHKRMYLTNWQIDQIKLQIGGPGCRFVELVNGGMRPMYMVPSK